MRLREYVSKAAMKVGEQVGSNDVGQLLLVKHAYLSLRLLQQHNSQFKPSARPNTPIIPQPQPKYMLSTKRVGLNPVSTANGSARKMTPTGHRNTCRHSSTAAGSASAPHHRRRLPAQHAHTHLSAFQEGQRAVPQEVEVVVVAQRDRVQRTRYRGRQEALPQQQRAHQELQHCNRGVTSAAGVSASLSCTTGCCCCK